jgi:hypothetical protein
VRQNYKEKVYEILKGSDSGLLGFWTLSIILYSKELSGRWAKSKNPLIPKKDYDFSLPRDCISYSTIITILARSRFSNFNQFHREGLMRIHTYKI